MKEFLTAVEECVRGTAVLEDMIFRRLPVVGNRLDRVFCTNRGVERSGHWPEWMVEVVGEGEGVERGGVSRVGNRCG